MFIGAGSRWANMNNLFTLGQMPTVLNFIPADDRDTWLNIGNALKTEYGEDAFETWDRWSQSGEGYSAQDAKSVWRSLTPGHVRLGTVIKLAKEAGWQPERREVSAEERKRLAAEAEARRRQRQAEIEASDEARRIMNGVVAAACRQLVEQHCSGGGRSEYLGRKRVGAHGVLFPSHSVVIAIDDQAHRADLWAGTEVKRFFDDLPTPRSDHLSFLMVKPGSIVVPLCDDDGVLWSVQVIQPGGGKMFPRYGRKSGMFHLIGALSDAGTVAVAEGYATAASVHEATGWPVAVALDAGNLSAVAQAMRRVRRDAKLVICGDDDLGQGRNPGRKKALDAAQAAGGVALFPHVDEVA